MSKMTMQQLKERRLTHTPTDIPHVRGNCGLSLKSPEGRGSVETLHATSLQTSSNNPDAALTPKPERGRRIELESICLVYVLSMRNKPLMPCSPPKARRLLKEGKAKVVRRTPFSIQLTMPTGESKQAVVLGVDSGYGHIGLSAITEKKEVYSADVRLRADLVKLNSERREYRRFRRYRKTWYRKPRFLNRKKPEGWFAPSIQHKLDSHLKIIDKIKEILPISQIVVEVAAFDIQKIKNPQIEGVEYQNGLQKGFWNVREYVLYRDGHICQCQSCKGKSKNPVLEVHHIVSRQIDGDRPDNLITLCSTCHEKVSKSQVKLNVKPSKSFKAETFMSTVRWKLVNNLNLVETHCHASLNEVEISPCYSYGYLTKQKRISLELAKSHINDAFVIAGGSRQKRILSYLIQQVRKSNRKLFKGKRSHIKNRAERFMHGFQRFDKVLWKGDGNGNGNGNGNGIGIECFIFGRRRSGYFDLRKLDGIKVCASAKAKELTLLERAKTLLIERGMALLPFLTEGVSEPDLR